LANGTLNLRFPDALAMDNVEFEDGALVLDWVVNEKNFAIALMDNGIEEMGSVLGTVTLCFVSVCLLTISGLDLPRPNRKVNKCVREHLQISLPKDLSGYEIDRISDIENPNDDTVADKLFHRNNFQPAKHSLVVKLVLPPPGTTTDSTDRPEAVNSGALTSGLNLSLRESRRPDATPLFIEPSEESTQPLPGPRTLSTGQASRKPPQKDEKGPATIVPRRLVPRVSGPKGKGIAAGITIVSSQAVFLIPTAPGTFPEANLEVEKKPES
jgi:hypothetical protein